MGKVLGFLLPFLTKRPQYDVEKVQGNNKFFMKRRALLGPGYLWGLVPALMLLIPSVLFIIGPEIYLIHNHHAAGVAVICVSKILILIVLAAMWRLMSQDPGIVPRRKMIHPEEDEDCNLEAPRQMIVNDVPVEVKYCKTCNIWKSPRVEHCRICDNCVEGYSHHSFLLGTCIGKRTYGNFFCFVCFTIFVSWMRFALSFVYLSLYTQAEMESQNLSRAEAFQWILQNSAASVAFVVIVLCGIGGVYSSYLFGKHVYLMWTNQSLHELKRGVWKNVEQKPFTDHGFKSISRTLFVSKPESKLHEDYCEDPEMEAESGPEPSPVSKVEVCGSSSEDGFIEII
ncbi:hypothetical protein NDN08_007329 [Rhodosorus marinus]|uniref:Palmitoyltransferase n=1 Tax=Rhodosorus marinus TaxID=101924 RepID=A0AAV8UIY2_9RHOD|nr:hypothetical protein NDN08_007329 [Rhodosorus marinus]